jgi:hypothetical protein
MTPSNNHGNHTDDEVEEESKLIGQIKTRNFECFTPREKNEVLA